MDRNSGGVEHSLPLENSTVDAISSSRVSSSGTGGSSGELADLYFRYWRPKAEAILVALGVEQIERDDLAQECFLGLLKARPRVACPEAYFLHSVRLGSIDRLRAWARRTFVELEAAFAQPGDEIDPNRRLDLARLLAQLEGHERELIEARWLEGKGHVELAEIHGIQSESMRKKLFRAMSRLRDLAVRR